MSSQGASLTATTHTMIWLCRAPPGSTSPWAPVLQGWGTPGCCGDPCARARECWEPIYLTGSRYLSWPGRHPRGLCCCEGPCLAQPVASPLVQLCCSHPSYSAPHAILPTSCSPHPELLGVPSHSDRIGQWGWHLPVPTLQAGRGRQSCVEPCCHSIIDGVTTATATAAIRAPVTSSVGLATETGPGWGWEVVLGCTRGPETGLLILELGS